jgi:CubicO group peptidase (beta-lactamase class C family)
MNYFIKTSIFFSQFIISAICFGQNNLNQLIDEYHLNKNFNGTVLVATDGKIDILKSVGHSNRNLSSPLQNNCKYKIASMTKAFTAVLVMKLVDEGKMDLNKTIGYYYPDYKGEGKDQITIHHLLTYSSGIENKAEAIEMQSYQIKTSIDNYINTYCSGKLISKPGEISNYANTEYIILHKIIEITTGNSYEKYLNKVILNPLQMTNTGVCLEEDIENGITSSYSYNDSLKKWSKDAPYYTEMFFGAGFLYATAEDILKFDEAIFKSKILTPASNKKLLQINPELGYTAYGFWGSDGYGTFAEPFYYRTGGILGASSNWIHTINSKKTIIVLSNTNATNLFELSEKLYLLSIEKK